MDRTVSDLIRRRNAGHLRIGTVRTYPQEDLAAALERLGIQYQGEPCREIDATEARQILTEMFSRDLAYFSDVMPTAEAERFSGLVMEEIFPSGAKFLTNISSFDPSTRFRGTYWPIFNGTEATFSVGVIAVAESVTACVWVEDED